MCQKKKGDIKGVKKYMDLLFDDKQILVSAKVRAGKSLYYNSGWSR